MFKGLRFLLAVGWMLIAFGVGLLVNGDLLPGVLLLALGLALGGVPLSMLLRSLRGAAGIDVRESPAYADPALRAGFRRTGRLLIILSLLPFAGAGAIMAAFWIVPRRDGASGGALVTMLLLGLALAAVPGLLGFGLLKSGRMVAAGDSGALDSAIRLNWIVVVLAGIATAGSLADDRPGYGMVAGVAGAVTAVFLLVNLMLKWFAAGVQIAEAEHPKATTS
jgi:hypothetical protein